VADFLARIRENGAKLVIVSSGFTKAIQLWFEIHGFDIEGITIHANDFLMSEDGTITALTDITRTPLDKFAELNLQPENFEKIIVIGDSLEDLPPKSMLFENTRTYGFCDTEGIYDVTLGTKGSFDEIEIA